MKAINIISSIVLASLFLISCKKEIPAPDTWQFTKLVNANLNNSGNLVSLDFYQKKGDQWRIVQFEPDDFTSFFLKKEETITPNSFQLPVENTNAFLTNNVRLFDNNDDKVYNPGNIKWPLGEPVQFKSFNTFMSEFPDMPKSGNSISKFSAATYSSEQAYDNNSKTSTYIFYDFPNQKYLYYGFRTGSDLIIENTLPLLCSTCGGIDWTTIDAVASTNEDSEGIYYFFDFDAQKMYILFRNYKNTNHPTFDFDNVYTFSFAKAFKGVYGTPTQNSSFDFTK